MNSCSNLASSFTFFKDIVPEFEFKNKIKKFKKSLSLKTNNRNKLNFGRFSRLEASWQTTIAKKNF